MDNAGQSIDQKVPTKQNKKPTNQIITKRLKGQPTAAVTDAEEGVKMTRKASTDQGEAGGLSGARRLYELPPVGTTQTAGIWPRKSLLLLL